MRYAFLLLGLFLSNLLLAQAQNFTDALAEGKILVTVKSQGGHNGQCISVHFEKMTDKSLKIKIPAGHIFECADSAYQNIIVLKNEEFALNNKKQFIRLYGVCAEGSDGSPVKDMAYQLGKMANGNVLKMAEYIAANRLWAHEDAQSAIWSMTDGYAPAYIKHAGLLSTACQLLNVPLPEYKINVARSTPAAAPQRAVARPRPVIQREPLSVEGAFEYQTNDSTEISVLVKNEAGDTVRTIFERQVQPPGRAKYSFYFKTTKLPPGNYEVILYDKDRAKKKIKVKY